MSLAKISPLIVSMVVVLILGTAGIIPGPVVAQDQSVELAPRHPDRYTVQRGDTLWDISAMFLRDPWYWPEIWHINPQIANPHLIYPGDKLSLVFDGGRPQLRLTRGRVERLSPQVREEPLEDAIPTIPYESVSAFLSRPTVLDRDQIDSMPYVLSTQEGHLVAGAGHSVYVRGTSGGEGTRYNVFHVGDPLVDPDDNDVIGYEGIYVGVGRISQSGDPSTLFLQETQREALEGDRLLPETTSIPMNFFPRAPQQNVEGRIIEVVDGLSLIGQYQIVVLNRGTRHGLESGHVLAVYQTGEVIRDRVGGRGMVGERVRLPDQPAGTLMVFQTYDRISYGLIMQATRQIRILDTVRNPS